MEGLMRDLGGAYSAVLVYIGDKLGLYKAMSDSGKPITSHELAALTQTSERNVREWLANQAAGGYVSYDADTQKYWLSPENALALVDENSSVFAMGGFQSTMSFFKDAQKLSKHSRQVEVSLGESMTQICSLALKGSSNQITIITLLAHGYLS
jgi:hypothetical protein